MKNIKRTFAIISILIFISASAIAQLPNPKEILLKAESAIRHIQSVAYQAEYYVIGTLKYGDKDAILTPYKGDILLARSVNDDSLGGKFKVQGERVRTKSDGSIYTFEIVYDGNKIRKLVQQEQVVYVNDPDDTGKALLIGASELILKDFQNKDPLQKLLSTENIKYKGIAVVGGVSCHIIHVSFSGDSFPSESIWFFGIDDYLPRRVQHVEYGRPEQEIMQVLTLTNLKTNVPIDPSKFIINVPEGFTAKTYQRPDKPSTVLQAGDIAPDWYLKDAGNRLCSLSDFRGKIVIIDFWATWCGPCREAMPILQKIHEGCADKGVAVMGINIWETSDPIKFMREKGYAYRLLLKGDEVAKKYSVNGIPTLYVIGPDGRILYGEVGHSAESYTRLMQVIKEHTEKKL